MMFFLNNINFSFFCKVLIWTLLHSIWQGLLLAIIVGLFIESTKTVKPHIRYNIFLACLLFFITTVLATSIYEINLHSSFYSEINNHMEHKGIQIEYPIYIEFDLISDFVLFINDYAIYFIVFWMSITILNLKNLLQQSYSSKKIRKNIEVTSELLYWQSKINDLSNYIQLTKVVRLAESNYVSAPVLIGYIKPIILFPIGLLNNLEPDEVEAIVLHELAHVKRNDYIVNYFQVLFDCLFFFNPGYLWISKLIRIERENCCDEFAVSKLHDKRIYIKSLIQSLEYQSLNKDSNLSLYFTYTRFEMVSRVERIINGMNPSLNKFQVIFLASALFICFSFLSFHKTYFEAPTLFDKKSHQEIKQIILSSDRTKKKDSLKHTCKKNSNKECLACISLSTNFNANISKLSSSNANPQLVQKMILALLSENIIQDVNKLSFYLDQTKFIVNGNELASCIATNFREKFLSHDIQFVRYR